MRPAAAPRTTSQRSCATAKALKLKDRGLLREGFRADVAIFDPSDFRDRATYADPHQDPSGGRTTVIVNGTSVVTFEPKSTRTLTRFQPEGTITGGRS